MEHKSPMYSSQPSIRLPFQPFPLSLFLLKRQHQAFGHLSQEAFSGYSKLPSLAPMGPVLTSVLSVYLPMFSFLPCLSPSLPPFLSFFFKLHRLLSQIPKARSLKCSLKGSRLGFFLASSQHLVDTCIPCLEDALFQSPSFLHTAPLCVHQMDCHEKLL